MTTKKTVFALIASLGLGLLPLAIVATTGCGDNPTDVFPFDAGTDAPRDSAADAAPDAPKEGGGGDGGGDGGGNKDAAADAPSDAPPG